MTEEERVVLWAQMEHQRDTALKDMIIAGVAFTVCGLGLLVFDLVTKCWLGGEFYGC